MATTARVTKAHAALDAVKGGSSAGAEGQVMRVVTNRNVIAIQPPATITCRFVSMRSDITSDHQLVIKFREQLAPWETTAGVVAMPVLPLCAADTATMVTVGDYGGTVCVNRRYCCGSH
ncbi:hypothetical protein GCM10022214_17640 [Actinomadura miaoliensis]|uniref:Uncharacterized protein n=1 Tax=Actinomadura miaoliensis TaxID=430685 RepID=A0ABP7VD08_9ACTN